MNYLGHAKQLQRMAEGDNQYPYTVEMGKLVALIAIAEQLEKMNASRSTPDKKPRGGLSKLGYIERELNEKEDK